MSEPGICGCPTATSTVFPTACPTYNCPLEPDCIIFSPTVFVPPKPTSSPVLCDFTPTIVTTAPCATCQTGCQTKATTSSGCYTATTTAEITCQGMVPTGCPTYSAIQSTVTVPPAYCGCPTTSTSTVTPECHAGCPPAPTFYSTVTAPY